MDLRGFENYLELSKGCSEKSIRNKINNLNWVINTCKIDLKSAISSTENMISSRQRIYKVASNRHLAEGYYNALRAYFQFMNGKDAPTLRDFSMKNTSINEND